MKLNRFFFHFVLVIMLLTLSGCTMEESSGVEGYSLSEIKPYIFEETNEENISGDKIIEIYVKGKIVEISEENIILLDNNQKKWQINLVHNIYDFSDYLNTECEVYGRLSSYTTYSTYDTGMYYASLLLKDKHSIKFSDGTVLKDDIDEIDENFKKIQTDSIQELEESENKELKEKDNQNSKNNSTQVKDNEKENTKKITIPPSETGSNLVWIPTNGGTKYHSRSSCSKMKNPNQVTKATAEVQGYTPCKKCY